MKKILLLIFVLSASLYITNCAFNSITIENSDYKFTESIKPGSQKFKIYLDVQGGQGVFSDNTTVGVKKNGYGWETAKIYIKPTIKDWVYTNLLNEFEKAGFTIVNDSSLSNVDITVNIDKIFVESDLQMDVSLVGLCKLNVTLKSKSKSKEYIRKFVGLDDTYRSVLGVLDDAYVDSYIRASNHAFTQIVDETFNLLTSLN